MNSEHNDSIDKQPIKMSELQKNWGEYKDIVQDGIARGAKFKMVSYTVSLVFFSYKNPVVYYIPPGGSSAGLTSGPNITTALLGWWGFPWGPIYSIQSFMDNRNGGKDITVEIVKALKMKTMGQVSKDKYLAKKKAESYKKVSSS